MIAFLTRLWALNKVTKRRLNQKRISKSRVSHKSLHCWMKTKAILTVICIKWVWIVWSKTQKSHQLRGKRDLHLSQFQRVNISREVGISLLTSRTTQILSTLMVTMSNSLLMMGKKEAVAVQRSSKEEALIFIIHSMIINYQAIPKPKEMEIKPPEVPINRRFMLNRN